MEATITGSVPSNLIIHQLMQVKLGVLVQSYDKKESFHFFPILFYKMLVPFLQIMLNTFMIIKFMK